jgi:isocitrate dehydrogenase
MKLTWTKTDEAPALASYSLLPILQAYFKGTGVEIETADISLAGRIVANFPERLQPGQRIPDELTRLGELAKTPEANIVSYPTSAPRFRSSETHCGSKEGYNIPDYRTPPLRRRSGRCRPGCRGPGLGWSRVREGNSDRRARVRGVRTEESTR